MDLALSYTQLAHTSNTSFRQALRAGFSNLEEAVQYYTAPGIRGIHYFVASNVKDYKKAKGALPVVRPKQFIEAYHKHS
jgi:hypothetical protein